MERKKLRHGSAIALLFSASAILGFAGTHTHGIGISSSTRVVVAGEIYPPAPKSVQGLTF